MIKLVLLFRRRPDITPAEFLRYWEEVHVPLVRQVPGIRRYVISPVLRSPDSGQPVADGMAELWFADEEALNAALVSPESAVTARDARNFIARGSIFRFVCLEVDRTCS